MISRTLLGSLVLGCALAVGALYLVARARSRAARAAAVPTSIAEKTPTMETGRTSLDDLALRELYDRVSFAG